VSDAPRAEDSRALHILHVDTERVWRGGQAQIAILMDALRARGHRSVLAAPEGPLAERARASGYRHVEFAPRSDLDLHAAIGLVRFARRERPDVVHLHSGRAHAAGWPTARMAGSASVVTRRVLFEPAGGAPPRRRLKTLLPIERVIAISTPIRDALKKSGVPEERIVVVPDALDVRAFEASLAAARAGGDAKALRASWGVPESARVCGMLAAFTPEKDYATFVDAAHRVAALRDDVCFVGVGEGPGLEAMREQVERAGLARRVLLPGGVADVAAAIAAFDACCLLSRAEGLGSSLLLAQAARLPVVATKVGGIPDLVADGVSGRLVPPGDGEEAARAIAEALDGGSEIERRVAEARRRLDAFDAPQAAAAHERVYRDAIARRAAGGTPWQRPR
jgi:glycosyltransferase involved in cell wall biosynthesis